MDGQWDQVYAGDVPPDFDQMRKREDRKERIKPFWDLLVKDKEPRTNKDTLIRLMHDLKEEGNTLFKEAHFDIAWMHYRNAIFVVKILETRFSHKVEKEFTSSLFSNRAFCCLKKDMYTQAVQDCESAITLYPKNIKAYYRQAQSLKHMKKYTQAYQTARMGDMIQSSSALKELIEELEPLVSLEHQSQASFVEVSAKEGASAAPIATPQPDSEWLSGTNITVTEKHLEAKSKMPGKKSKKKRLNPSTAPKTYADFCKRGMEEEDDDDDDEEEEEDDSEEGNSSLGVENDQEFANMYRGVQKNSSLSLLNGGGSIIGSLDIRAPRDMGEDSAWSFPHDADNDDVPIKTASVGGMGLDTFSAPGLPTTDFFSSESASLSNTSSGRSSRASQSPAKSLAVGTPTRRISKTTSPSPEYIPPITFPLIDEYDFGLACQNCFLKIGEGAKGYRLLTAAHDCQHDILIIKKRAGINVNWVRVRTRAVSKSHYGQYKICSEFSQSKPCKVSEDKCSFPHHQAELKLWTMDREKKFSIEDFIAKCSLYNILNKEDLESKCKATQYIPGLNFAVEKPRNAARETRSSSFENQSVSVSVSQPIKQAYVPNKQVSGPVSQQNQSTVAPGPFKQTSPPNQMKTIISGQQPSINNRSSGFSMSQPPNTTVNQYGFQSGSSNQYVNVNHPPPPLPGQMNQPWISQAPQVIREQPATPPAQAAKLENPLSKTHDSMIVCQQCFKPTAYFGMYEFKHHSHKCEENILAMRPKDTSYLSTTWFRVRERKNHRDFQGNYILCRSVTMNNPKECKYGIEICSFAHNEAERFFWMLEKAGKFNITEFLLQNRKFSAGIGFSLREILNKHGGYFEFICRSCFYGTPAKISLEGSNSRCSGEPPHSWKDFSILAHIGPEGTITLINTRGFLHKTAFFKICRFLQYCRSRVKADCRFAHSMVERDVWMLERDCDISRKHIVKESKELQNLALPPSANTKVIPVVQSAMGASITDSKLLEAIPQATEEDSQAADRVCPYNVLEICETCWKKGQKTQQEPGKDRCQKSHANWSRNIAYLLSPSNKELRPLPKRIPKMFNFIVCKFVQDGRKCGFTGAGPCQFAHSTEEQEIWRWMCNNKVETLQQLSDKSKVAQKIRAESIKAKISGQSVVSVSPTGFGPSSAAAPLRASFPVASVHTFYCQYCGISCNSQKQWDDHCASEKHNFNMNSDKEHQWNYRQPPWGTGRNYLLCAKHLDHKTCQYSHVPEMYNMCRYAHSQEELDEWQERYEWRLMKREMARQEKVFSYMDQLLEKYENSENCIDVITESLEGVEITTTGDLNIYREDKYTSYIWKFDIKSKKLLERVALLYNRDRLHFGLFMGGEKTTQIAQGEIFAADVDHDGVPCYQVAVKFTGGMFGSFQQWVLFDFGGEPVLCRKISVEVGDQLSHEMVRNLREQLTFDRWNSMNRQIVKQDTADVLETSLISKYKEPSSASAVVTQTTVTMELNRHNYVSKMHKLLELEEMTRHQIIASYNLVTTIECQDVIQETTHVFAKPGELFAKVNLQENLTEDTDAGKLILTSVRKVFLAPETDSDKVVYESFIVREENFNYDGRCRDMIYLCLSPECVRQLRLKKGSKISVEIQFQMDRLFFCRMHYAVDQLNTTSIVFPDVPKINPLRNERHNLKVGSSVLNPDQLAAVRHIVAERTGYTPPFVLYGPFGTGKTETIAQATMVLLKETHNTRILICAQSNSAADLYIVKHLDPFLKKLNMTAQLRRVYFKERRVYTVASEIKKYCLLSADGDIFEMPTKEDIEKHRVVIATVTTALYLTSLKLQGYFTHIFIDEAAQTMECEALMPLSLATEKTCIVLAGDHKQISPKVYSEAARAQNFHQSLLERLYNYYDFHSNLIDHASPLNILLSINYRSKMEILRFISVTFYGGPDVLKSEANIKSVVGITPLVFYAVQGHEVQDKNSISYYNMSEVQEIVERVDDLFDKWPQEWGPKSAQEIGVVTPYYDQVVAIRKALKKRNIALKDVMVERVQGVQGKEFRAMFITTVRTRYLIDAPHIQRQGLADCDGDIGDFGFLSDPKLLNTALTRAQSLVVVVGDPVALCAVGECVNVWRLYLKHCQNMSSLYPKNISYDSIRIQVQNLNNSPVRERLLEIANERQAQKMRGYKAKPVATAQASEVKTSLKDAEKPEMQTPVFAEVPPSVSGSHVNSAGPGLNFSVGISQQQGISMSFTNGMSTRPPLAPLSSLAGVKQPVAANLIRPQLRKVEACFELGEEYSLDPEDVLLQLSKSEASNGAQVSPHGNLCLYEQNGFAFVSSDGENNSTEMAPTNYDSSQMQRILKADSNKYVRCILHITETSCYASVLKPKNGVSRYEIPSRWMCGRANDSDEVVVEVLKAEITGRVVGVLKRSVDLNSRYIICHSDGSTGVMIPVNIGLSPMISVSTPTYVNTNLDGNISVYRVTKSKQVRFSRLEKVSHAQVNEKLFVVRYLKWNSRLRLPMCMVVGVVPSVYDIVTGMQAFELEYGLTKTVPTEVSEAAQSVQLTTDLYRTRTMDLRERWAFIISDQSAEDVSQAFSIDQQEDGSYLLGIHIADVATLIPQGSILDRECAHRGLTMSSPLCEAEQKMLPGPAAAVCSLQLNQDRLAISVLLTVQSHGELTQMNVHKSLINCKQKYSFQEAEEILQDPNAHQDYVKSCILVLYQISRFWRRQRLGNAALFHDGVKEYLAPFSHQLVNEIVIMTEHHIGKIFKSRNEDAIPTYVQSAPDSRLLNKWRRKFAADAINSIALTKPFLKTEQQETCNCGLACTHTVNYVRNNSMQKRDFIDVVSVLWDTISDALAMGDTTYIQNVIIEVENHPQLALAFTELNSLQEMAKFMCSGDVPLEHQYHYNINLAPYICMSKPLDSYIDLVSQRFLVACIDNLPSPYSTEEAREICSHFNSVSATCHRYEQDVFSLHLCSALQSHPVMLQTVIKRIEPSFFELCFPSHHLIKPVPTVFDYSLLGVCEVVEQDGCVTVRWQERVYNCSVLRNQAIVGAYEGELNPDRYIYKIPAFQWQKLLTAVREKDDMSRDDKLVTAVESIRKQVQNPALSGNYIDDVTSEVFKLGKIKHYTDFCMQLHPCQVLQVQISSMFHKGQLAPYVQLLNLTPNLDICLQHRSQPQNCFSRNIASVLPVTSPGSDVRSYTIRWEPLIEMEAAERAIISNERIVVQNVSMVWKEESTSSQMWIGQFSLPVKFMSERQIKFHSEKHLQSLFSNSQYCNAYFSDFVCVRYHNIQLPAEPGLSEAVSRVINSGALSSWVGHCKVVGVNLSNGDVKFRLELIQSDVPLPVMSLQRLTCTVEIIQRTYKDRNILYALNCLESSPSLPLSVLFRRPVPSKLPYSDVDKLISLANDLLGVANQQQDMAVEAALQQSFTVIQGGPGTGKSNVVAKLAVLFSKRNLLSHRGHVLICASSDTSLDVLTVYLSSLHSSCPNLVRIYSEDVERVVHPSSRALQRPSSLTSSAAEEIQARYSSLSLYNLVRKSEDSWCTKISEFETLFSLYADDITDDQFEEYEALVEKAELSILRDCQVILCTTDTAALLKYSSAINVLQVIIDDAHNCSEPELLMPLTSHGALQQLVMVGDTKQLTPCVSSHVAAQLGLAKPLMAAFTEIALELTEQYRMHEAIADFPVRVVYGNKPKNGVMPQPFPGRVQWPGNRPYLFCNLPGAEINFYSSPSVGKEHTILNTQQADFAVLVSTYLKRQSSSGYVSVAVLSTTQAQASYLQKRLESDVASLTVDGAQGQEFDYVVLTTVRNVEPSRVELQPNTAWRRAHLGSLTDSSYVTVAITRAKKGLIIIGDETLLRCDSLWDKLLAEYEAANTLMTADQLLNTWAI